MGFRGLNYGGFQGLLPENEEELLFTDASDDSPPSWDTQMMGRRTSEAIYPSSTPSSAAGLIHSPALAEAFLTNALEDFLEQHNINLLSVNSAKVMWSNVKCITRFGIFIPPAPAVTEFVYC